MTAERVSASGLGIAGAALLAMLALTLGLSRPVPSPSPAEEASPAASAYGKLPLSFVPNRGQTDRRVLFSAQGAGYGFFLRKDRVTLSLERGGKGAALELRFKGANPAASIIGTRRLGGTVNYIGGADRHTAIPTYGAVTYRELWPGIDLVFRGAGGALKYEFHVAAGADPRDIRLAYAGADGLSHDAGGSLLIETPLGTMRDAPPKSYQGEGAKRRSVSSRYAVDGTAYGFAVGGYDRSRALVIDPGIEYSTYLGGNYEDQANDIAVDADGSVYVAGTTSSPDFPTTPGAYNPDVATLVFVTKLNPAGTGLEYSTYLGTAPIQINEEGTGIAVDRTGSAYVTGITASSDFPVTPGAFDTSSNGDFDGFVAKLSHDGSDLEYASYLGGSSTELDLKIALDSASAAYISGRTGSVDFPTTTGAFDRTFNGGEDAFVAKLNPGATGLQYSTFVGGDGFDTAAGIAVDPTGSAYMTGTAGSGNFPTTPGAFDTSYGNGDPVVSKLTADGSALAYSTFVNAEGNGYGIAASPTGNAYVTGKFGFPQSTNFVAKLNTAGSALDYQTQLLESGVDVALDDAGAAYVAGPPFGDDVAVAKLAPDGTVVYSTVFGGSAIDRGHAIAADDRGAAYVAGQTFSRDYPTTPGAFDRHRAPDDESNISDAFITKVDTTPAGSTPRCKVSGKGRISMTRAFQIEASTKNKNRLKGHVAYADRAAHVNLRSKQLTSLTVDADHAIIRGTAVVNGETVTFRVDANDRQPDFFRIAFFTASSFYAAEGDVRPGHIRIDCKKR